MPNGRRWTREELLIAYNLYCKIPFGKIYSTNPVIIDLASALNRTPSSLAMKLTNFASLDPILKKRGIKGLTGVSNADRDFFQEFQKNWDDYAVESEMLIQKLKIPDTVDEDDSDFPKLKYLEKTEKETIIKIRVGQSFFRKLILANYDYRCALTGNPVPQLLRASHILPWHEFPKERLNPHNGICLSALHDAAFDRFLISFDDKLRLIIGPKLKKVISEESLELNFLRYEGKPLSVPDKYKPATEFLKWHREKI